MLSYFNRAAVRQHSQDASFRLDNWLVCPATLAIQKGSHSESLTPKAMDCLIVLVENFPAPITRRQLLDEVWGQGRGSDEVLSQVIAELRRKFRDSAQQAKFIKTLPKIGYQLSEHPVFESAAARKKKRRSATRLGSAVLCFAIIVVVVTWRHSNSVAPTLDYGSLVQVAGSVESEIHPSWSKSGDKITYTFKNPATGSHDIAIRSQNGETSVLATPNQDEFSPILDEASNALYFLRYIDQICEVVVSDILGKKETALGVCASRGGATSLDLSGDGKQLAFTMPTDSERYSRGIRIISTLDGSILHEANSASPLDTLHSPRFSPDDSKLVYRVYQQSAEARNIHVLDLQSKKTTTIHGRQVIGADWFSNQALIVTTQGVFHSNAQIIATKKPTERKHLGILPNAAHLRYRNKTLLFTQYKGTRSRIDMIRSGSGVVEAMNPQTEFDAYPRVSSDGKLLAMLTRQAGKEEVRIINLSTNRTGKKMTLADEVFQSMDWQSSRELIVVTKDSRERVIARLWNLESGAETMMDLGCNAASVVRKSHVGSLYAFNNQANVVPQLCAWRNGRSKEVVRGIHMFGFGRQGELLIPGPPDGRPVHVDTKQSPSWVHDFDWTNTTSYWVSSKYGFAVAKTGSLTSLVDVAVKPWDGSWNTFRIDGVVITSLSLSPTGDLYFAAISGTDDTDVLQMNLQ